MRISVINITRFSLKVYKKNFDKFENHLVLSLIQEKRIQDEKLIAHLNSTPTLPFKFLTLVLVPDDVLRSISGRCDPSRSGRIGSLLRLFSEYGHPKRLKPENE